MVDPSEPRKCANGRRSFQLLCLLAAVSAANPASAEDWGSYSIVPASAQGLVLEAVAAGTNAGTVVSIGKPTGAWNQKWLIASRRNNLCSIRPAHAVHLALAVSQGGLKLGTPIVLETDEGKPWQEWALKKNEDGSYCVLPPHAPGYGLDHLGGNPRPGAKIDLWTNAPGDPHLRWFIRPLAGSPITGAVGAAESPPSTYVAPDIPAEQIRKGRIKEGTFSESAIFPGTVRRVTVFIPAQYDGSKPACVYVKTDGYNPHEKELAGNADRHQGNARDRRRVRPAGRLARCDKEHHRTPESLFGIRRRGRQ